MTSITETDVRFDRMHRTMNTVLLITALHSVLGLKHGRAEVLGVGIPLVLLTAFVGIAIAYSYTLVDMLELPTRIQEGMKDV